MTVVCTETHQYLLIAICRAVQKAQDPKVSFVSVQQEIRALEENYPLYEAKVGDMPLEQSPALEDLHVLWYVGDITLDAERQEISITDLGVLTFWSLHLP